VRFCITACGPPVGLYDPKDDLRVQAAVLHTTDDRFKEPKCNGLHMLTHFV